MYCQQNFVKVHTHWYRKLLGSPTDQVNTLEISMKKVGDIEMPWY